MVTTAIALALIHSPLLIAAGLAVFVLPGAVLLAALRLALRLEERLAWWFAASLVLLTAAFAACVASGATIEEAPFALAIVTTVASFAGRRLIARRMAEGPADRLRPSPGLIVIVVVAAASVAAAVEFAPVGSIDRWWYLAYVRGYLEPSPLNLAEPFLGTGQSFARFGFHPWLFGLAMWSSLSTIDPVEVYERAAPVLAVLASVSATIALAIELFGRTAATRLAILATMLLWSGGLVPVLARAGEDKVLAASALLPLGLAAFLRVLREGRAWARRPGREPVRDGREDALVEARGASPRSALLLLFFAAAATASVHALAYAFVLVALVPLAALVAWSSREQRRIVACACAILVAVAVAPAVSGLVVRERLGDIGADLAHDDHPVVRVHEARDRLVELPVGGYVISPRLLVHPLALLALLGLVAATARARDDAQDFLLVTAFVPLAIAFVPPLPALAGTVIPPWMVYRVLWLLPLAGLAALGADWLASRATSRPGRREALAMLIVLALGLPSVVSGTRSRLAEVRERLATPSSEDFAGAMQAIAALPRDAVVVAAPELSERIPALTGRHVAAALDRSTIVFSGSREQGEARLRARAALLAGDPDGSELARAAGVVATHAVYDLRVPTKPRCGRAVYRSFAWEVCELEHGSAVPAVPSLVATDKPGSTVIAVADCEKTALSNGRRDPWSAALPMVRCHAVLPDGTAGAGVLRIEVDAGRAADELRIDFLGGSMAPGEPWEQVAWRPVFRGSARIDCCGLAGLELPWVASGPIEIRIASAFLPAVRPRRVAIVAP